MILIKMRFFCTIFFLTTSPLCFAQQVKQTSVYTYASATVVEKVLKDLDLKFKAKDRNLYEVTLNDSKALLTIEKESLQFWVGFSNKQGISANRINDFNKQYKWCRAYLDDDGDAVLESDLSFTGGVTKDGLYSFVNTFGKLVEAFSEHLQ